MAKRPVFHSTYSKKEDAWHNKEAGKGVVSTHGTQKDSEAAAIRSAKAAEKAGGKGQAVLHKKDHTIREERTFGGDPERTKG